MSHIFNSTVFVKPLGLMIPSNYVENIAFNVEVSREFKLVEPDDLVAELHVASMVSATFIATVVLPTELVRLSKGAKAYNQYNAALEEYLSASNEPTAAAEPARGRGRRRRNAAPVEANEEDVIEEEKFKPAPDMQAYSFSFFKLNIEEASTPLEESMPYDAVASRSENNRDLLEQKLAVMTSGINKINQMRHKLQSPVAPELDNALSTLVPKLNYVTDDSIGLENFENNLRRSIHEMEERVRDTYRYLDEKVVKSYNQRNSAKNILPFDGEFSFATETVSLKKLVEEMNENLFIRVK